MKRSLVVVALLGLVGLLGACGVDSASRAPTTALASTTASACDEVVLGIDAFNIGDLEETVAHFERAVPLAEAEAEADDSQEAEALLDAVRYYAELSPEDYPEASASSPDFARNKAITLSLCAYEGPPGSPAESPSEPGQSI